MTEYHKRSDATYESLVNQIQNSMFVSNGNFIDRSTTADSASLTNHPIPNCCQGYDCGTSNDNSHYRNIQHGQEKWYPSISTYDYLYSQWKEAISNLSWKVPVVESNAAATIDNSSDITLIAKGDDSKESCTNTMSYFDLWYQKLWKMHTSYDTRYYHTVVHLEEMCYYLQLVYTSPLWSSNQQYKSPKHKKNNRMNDSMVLLEEKVGVQLSIKSLLLLCTFFHDAIYDTHSSTNEEDSATLFKSFAINTDLHPASVQLVAAYILATKHHTIGNTTTRIPPIDDSNNDVPYDPLEVFLDIDMSVLGKVPMAYQQYSVLIRKEYSFVSPDIYCSKRADILEQFLTQSKRIYHTTLFYDAFERRAQFNVQQEIQLLRQGIIPSLETMEKEGKKIIN
jgi:predicted metal-dependent HD superfamily phosphohydrolase